MSHAKASTSLHLAPPLPDIQPRVVIGSAYSPGAIVRRPEEGVYYETMPADLGRDGDLLQGILLASPRARPSLLRVLLAWYVAVTEWLTSLWRSALAMLGVTR